MFDLELKGSAEFFEAAAKLKEAGATGLTKELNSELRKAMLPARRDLKTSARMTLPASGGLGARVAGSKFRTRKTRKVGITMRASGGASGGAQLGAMDEGWLRHPVHGNDNAWVRQSVTPGWFTRPMDKQKPNIRHRLGIAVGAVLHELAQGDDD